MTNTFKSTEEYIKTLDKRIALLNKPKSVKLAAKYCMLIAKKLAPHKTGETMLGIRKRDISKNKSVITSQTTPKGKSGFMQNFWADGQSPHATPRMRWNKSKPTPFPKRKGKYFFSNAAKLTRNRFNKLMVSEVRTIMSKK